MKRICKSCGKQYWGVGKSREKECVSCRNKKEDNKDFTCHYCKKKMKGYYAKHDTNFGNQIHYSCKDCFRRMMKR